MDSFEKIVKFNNYYIGITRSSYNSSSGNYNGPKIYVSSDKSAWTLVYTVPQSSYYYFVDAASTSEAVWVTYSSHGSEIDGTLLKSTDAWTWNVYIPYNGFTELAYLTVINDTLFIRGSNSYIYADASGRSANMYGSWTTLNVSGYYRYDSCIASFSNYPVELAVSSVSYSTYYVLIYDGSAWQASQLPAPAQNYYYTSIQDCNGKIAVLSEYDEFDE